MLTDASAFRLLKPSHGLGKYSASICSISAADDLLRNNAYLSRQHKNLRLKLRPLDPADHLSPFVTAALVLLRKLKRANASV